MKHAAWRKARKHWVPTPKVGRLALANLQVLPLSTGRLLAAVNGTAFQKEISKCHKLQYRK